MTSSQASEFIDTAKNLLRKIETYEHSGTEAIRPEDLEVAKQAVRLMVAEVEQGKLPRTENRHRSLTRMILDQWPLGNSLGGAISELEENYINL